MHPSICIGNQYSASDFTISNTVNITDPLIHHHQFHALFNFHHRNHLNRKHIEVGSEHMDNYVYQLLDNSININLAYVKLV